MVTELPYVPTALDQSSVRYAHGPDSVARADVPAGTVTVLEWDDSESYPGTSRRVQVHVPSSYDAAEPANLVVLLDGDYFLDPAEALRAGIVLDNLVGAGDLPMTIGVFVDPGDPGGSDDDARAQRRAEYDAPDDRFAGFLLDEVLPRVAARWSLSEDPSRRAIGGFSSGGSAAFTVAWHRPDAFGRVLALLPSFAQVAGGDPYPALVPQVPAKPLRVLVQEGHRDLGWDEPEHNWLAENLRVVAALAEAAYDVRLVLGDGAHDPNHGGVILPDALRWLFRPDDVAHA